MDTLETENYRLELFEDSDNNPREWAVGHLVAFAWDFEIGPLDVTPTPEECWDNIAAAINPEIEELDEDLWWYSLYEKHYSSVKDTCAAAELADEEYENSFEEFHKTRKRVIDAALQEVLAVPVYVARHGGYIGLNTNQIGYPWNCPWDCRQLGFIYITKKEVVDQFGDWNTETQELAYEALRAEVYEYSKFLASDSWYLRVTHTATDEVIGNAAWIGWEGWDHAVSLLDLPLEALIEIQEAL